MDPMNADVQPGAHLSVPAYALNRADYAPSAPIAPEGATVSGVAFLTGMNQEKELARLLEIVRGE